MVYSHFQEAKDPNLKKITLAAMFFAFLAGHVNAVLISLGAVSVSHLSGNVSHLGELALPGIRPQIQWAAAVLVSFLLGAFFSGYQLMDAKYASFRKYGVLMIVEGLALLMAAWLSSAHLMWTVALCAFGMGVQNAMVSSYKGLIIRTTHMTGIITDLGFLLGRLLKVKQWSQDKMFFLFSTLVAFFVGACSGFWSALRFEFLSIYFCGGLCVLLGVLFYWQRVKHQASIR
ncbi:MAG: DUF1275 domain-containing protein [Deltaproteobacteria bacterium]|nr:DUF1275 domain-containing protein [Deltaproteobacteria bacterium]